MPASRDSADPHPSNAVLGRAAAAATRAGRRRRALAADLFLPDDVRLDERVRTAVRSRLAALVGAIERDLRVGTANRLAERGAAELAAAVTAATGPLLDRLIGAGVFDDDDLAAELIGQAGLAHLAADLLAATGDGSERPSLLIRLGDCPEPPVAAAATELLAASNAARGDPPGLSDPFHARLCWWVAAALSQDTTGAADQAIVEAALDVVARPLTPEQDRAALTLAQAIAARPDELADLLIEALGDRVPALFVALVADAVALPASEVRDALLDRDAARLVVMLRAAGLERSAIARIGVALAHADPRRDLERLADLLDAAAPLAPAEALAGLAPLAWPQPFRDAQRRLEERA